MYKYKNMSLAVIITLVFILIPVIALGGDIKVRQIPLVLFTVFVYRYVLKVAMFILELFSNEVSVISKGLEEGSNE